MAMATTRVRFMPTRWQRGTRAVLTLSLLLTILAIVRAQDAPFGLKERAPWTNVHLVGSPEPPLPYTTEPVFDSIQWERPIYAKTEPGTTNLVVVEQGGEKEKPSQVHRLSIHDSLRRSTLLEIPERLIYGLAFDPHYRHNGHLYVFSNGPTGEAERKNRIARFTVSREDKFTCDPTSELVILEWRSMGHDGGELGFGSDGMLYISTGDGTSDSDVWLSAQDVSNLLGGVLRIDVRQATTTTPYTVPKDNPFVELEHARPELWAIGLRNPWRLWCDQQSGQIWVGNNGQDLWETIHLIRRGENYGWSVYEGSHPFYAERQRGPAPIVGPTIEHHHTVARSLTGGVVYRGSRLPELDGAYIYGDYSTGRIWGVRHDGKEISWHEELADTTHQIAGFAIAPSGNLLVVDHGGSLHRLIRSPRLATQPAFPRSLSQTGLFQSVRDHRVAPGVISYSVNAPGWNDGAEAERFLAVPDDASIAAGGTRGWNFPNGTVLAQTLSLKEQRVETRILLRQQNEWEGYSYRWNAAQTDAELVGRDGEELTVKGQRWHIPSRSECMSCHSRAVHFVLGLSNPQMNRTHDYGDVEDNQLRTLHHIGLLKEKQDIQTATLVNPYDKTQDITQRARSYLHVNCSSCHVEAGGGNARMELEFHRDVKDMRLVSARPQHVTFDITNAMLVAPGEPRRSVLMQRVSRRGPGQMPPLVSRQIDHDAVELIQSWIASMEKPDVPFVKAWKSNELMEAWNNRTDAVSTAEGKKTFGKLGCGQCHRIGNEGGGAGPDLSQVTKRLTPGELIQSILEPSATIAPGFETTVIVTTEGQAIQGRIEFEDESVVRIRSSASFDRPVLVSKADIEDRRRSQLSTMPAGMLYVCTQQEILDLLAFLTAGGHVPEDAAE